MKADTVKHPGFKAQGESGPDSTEIPARNISHAEISRTNAITYKIKCIFKVFGSSFYNKFNINIYVVLDFKSHYYKVDNNKTDNRSG